MAVGRCDQCGVEEYMPFVCKFCRGRYCASHRLPENHGCTALDDYKARVRQEGGPWVKPEPQVVAPKVSARANLGMKADELIDRVQGRAAQALLAVMGGVFLTQMVLAGVGLGGLANLLFVLDEQFYFKPWTILTSIFAHAGFNHFLINAIVLFFFGPSVEQIIGTKRFLKLFLIAGIAAGLTQVIVFAYLLPAIFPANPLFGGPVGVVGASGGIMGLFGMLAVLAPTMRVLLFFVVPVPMWLITVGYALLDTYGAIIAILEPAAGGNVAHLAHLAGLAFGLAFGKKLHDEGLRVRVRQQSSSSIFGGGGRSF